MSFSKIASELHNLNERLKKSKQVYLLVVALIIGILGGFGAVGFRELIAFFQRIAWDTDKFTQAMVSAKSVWWILLTPAIGGLIVGAIVHYFAPEARGHGVPEVMEAVALKGGRIRARVVGAKALASGICIATGGSVGREGPIVQIGSAIGSVIGQILQFGAGRMRTVVGCGAAAGIAATFNAPIAGAIFALEILVGDFAVVNFSPIVISSVSATIVSRWYFGDEAAFVDIPEYALNHPLELVTYACLGLLAGIVALIFTRTLYFSEDQFDRIKITLPLKACLGGLIIGAIAIQYPQILGVGYEAMEAALTKSILWQTLAILLVVKIVAVSITIGSGGSGGVFAPSLFIGRDACAFGPARDHR